MAKAIGSEQSLGSSFTPSLRSVWMLRLIIGTGIVLGGAISLIGTSWDIQWHVFIGRDRTLIPPHEMMLAGITIGGLLALISVILETFWVKRNKQLGQYSTNFAGLFSSSLGAYVAGFAALNSAIAFPLDSYWHALYGIDVAIWAPFHVMIISGMAIMPLGGAYMLASGGQLARITGDERAVRISRIATLIALATMLSVFTLMLSDALDQGNTFYLGNGFGISVFPLLAGLLTAYTFVAAKYAVPYRAAASYVLIAYIVFALLFSAFVPTATHTLVGSEGLHYRKQLSQFADLSIVAVRFWPLLPIIIAPLLDVCFSQAKRHNWSGRRQTISFALIALLSFFPVFALEPTFGVEWIGSIGIAGLLISLLLGFVGTYLGTQLGQYTGKIMSQEER